MLNTWGRITKEFPRASVKVAMLHGFKSTPDTRQLLAVMGKSLEVNAKEDFLDFKVVSRNGCTPFDDTSLCIMATREGLHGRHGGWDYLYQPP